MLASGSCLLSDIVDQLHENARKVNSVERLARHLNKGFPIKALVSYLSMVCKWVPSEPVIHIDDSDIIKPDDYKFEALGLVMDGSKSTDSKTVYEEGYHITGAYVLTDNGHPVSIFSEIYSSMVLAMERLPPPNLPRCRRNVLAGIKRNKFSKCNSNIRKPSQALQQCEVL